MIPEEPVVSTSVEMVAVPETPKTFAVNKKNKFSLAGVLRRAVKNVVLFPFKVVFGSIKLVWHSCVFIGRVLIGGSDDN